VGLSHYSRRTFIRELALFLVAIAYCLPLYVLIAIALERTDQTYKAPLSLPGSPQWGNFSEAWKTAGQRGMDHALLSSLIITLASVVALIALGSLCAYTIARRAGRISSFVYVLFVVAIILPFQLAIIPLYAAMRELDLVGTYLGMIVLNTGLLMPLTVFLYTGFIRALPRDYEEAARVDGAGILQTFARVVFPLLWPITATVAVFLGIVVWNEFFIALVFLTGSRFETVPVAVYSLAGEDVARWNLIFAGIAITIVPILALFVFAQRRLVRGFSAGVKG
jgi:raffinose/stachyose/melibiose transport system permease protein